MHVRCDTCRQAFNLAPDYMVQALARAEKKGHKYHVVDCINCRRKIRVSVATMRQHLPAGAGAADDAGEAEAEAPAG